MERAKYGGQEKNRIDKQRIYQLNAALPSHSESSVMPVISLMKNSQ